jgi:hypothetical protein
MSMWSSVGNTLGAGLAGAGLGFVVGGPVGAAAGAGIGMLGSALGMSGHGQMGGLGGAAIGGLAGFAIGGPVGGLIGGLGGALLGGAIGNAFNKPPQTPPYAAGMPSPMMGGAMGYPMMGGMGFPMMGGMMGGMGMGAFPGMGGGMMGGMMGGNMAYMMAQQQMQQQLLAYMQMQQQLQAQQGGVPTQQPGNQASQNPNAGTLSGGNGQPINYTTHGGYQVKVEGSTVTVTTPDGKQSIQEWGDPHEKINGTAVKDWDAKNMVMVLGDGTKIDMSAQAKNSTINNTTIIDGNQSIEIDNTQNQVTSTSCNPYRAQWLESGMTHQGATEVTAFGYAQNGSFVAQEMGMLDDNGNFTAINKDLGSQPAPAQPQPKPHHDDDDYRPMRLGNRMRAQYTTET